MKCSLSLHWRRRFWQAKGKPRCGGHVFPQSRVQSVYTFPISVNPHEIAVNYSGSYSGKHHSGKHLREDSETARIWFLFCKSCEKASDLSVSGSLKNRAVVCLYAGWFLNEHDWFLTWKLRGSEKFQAWKTRYDWLGSVLPHASSPLRDAWDQWCRHNRWRVVATCQ